MRWYETQDNTGENSSSLSYDIIIIAVLDVHMLCP